MKVALVTETFLPNINGIVRTLERLILHLEANGHEVLIIAMGGGSNHYSKSTVVRIPGERFFMYPELYLALPENWLLRALTAFAPTQVPMSIIMSVLANKNQLVSKALDEFNPDLVHIVSPATLGAMAYHYVREKSIASNASTSRPQKSKLPYLATYHTDIAAYTAKYHVPFLKTCVDLSTRIVYGRADKVLAPSMSSKLQLEQDCGLKNVGIFSRGVDTKLFRDRKLMSTEERKALQISLGLDPDCLTILYAGRLAGEKSIPVLIRDFKHLSDAGHPVQLLLVGDGPIRSSLEESLKRYTAVFAGFKQNEDYARMFQIADIFAFPSRTETFGQVVQEAMASALPVIVFDAPGVRDLIEHKRTGLVASDDTMIDELESLIKDQALRSSLGDAAHQESRNKSWDEVLKGLVQEYQSLISK